MSHPTFHRRSAMSSVRRWHAIPAVGSPHPPSWTTRSEGSAPRAACGHDSPPTLVTQLVSSASRQRPGSLCAQCRQDLEGAWRYVSRTKHRGATWVNLVHARPRSSPGCSGPSSVSTSSTPVAPVPEPRTGAPGTRLRARSSQYPGPAGSHASQDSSRVAGSTHPSSALRTACPRIASSGPGRRP